eukprot:scaffold9393_cov66-Phaeocystis_antarctica.AAC.8
MARDGEASREPSSSYRRASPELALAGLPARYVGRGASELRSTGQDHRLEQPSRLLEHLT